MADVPFTKYRFAATHAPTLRTLPDRLVEHEFINVKDWGAKGNGLDDDTDAINACIDYAGGIGSELHKGATIYFPPGTYILSKSGTTPLILDRPGIFWKTLYGAGQSRGRAMRFVGAGRDVTILKGNYYHAGQQTDSATASFLVKSGMWSGQIQCIRDLTIWNESTGVNSGAYLCMSSGNNLQLINLHFRGTIGAVAQSNSFDTCWIDCVATNTRPITSADASGTPLGDRSTARSPLFSYDKFQAPIGSSENSTQQFGSVGIAIGQGRCVGCRVYGYDVGFALPGSGHSLIGCYAYRCGVGFCWGLYLGSARGVEAVDYLTTGATNVDVGRWMQASCTTVVSNWAERCTWGMYWESGGVSLYAANRVSGTTGPNDPAQIDSMTRKSGSPFTVHVTTHVAHNIVNQTKVQIVDPSTLLPLAGWTTDPSGFVVATVTGADTFTYPGPRSAPPTFSSGAWNYPLEYAMSIELSTQGIFASNVLDAMVSKGSFDMKHEERWSPTMINNMCWATRGPYGFPMFADNAIKSTRYSWMFDKCGVVGANPPYAKGKFGKLNGLPPGNPYCGTGPFEGDECTLIDCATQNSFGGIVTSGGSNHYKVRYDSTNWVRVG